MSKKVIYEPCELEVKLLGKEDVILTSGWSNIGGENGSDSDDNGWT